MQGNKYFAHVLSLGLDTRLNTLVETVTFRSSGVECLGETYPAVVSSLPGPETARLFALDQSPAEYDPCLVALLEYAGTNLGQSRECYARLLPEGKEPILSSYCENHKVGRIAGNKTVFVVQAAPHFSREHADAPPETYLPQLAREHEALWRIPSGLCTASSGHCWRHARPRDDHQRRRVDLPRGGFICGDSRSDSTVEDVWLDGRQAAKEVFDYLTGLAP